MLGEIHRDKKTVPQPSLDDISHDTFAFQHIPPKEIGIGAFAWNMHFYWMNVPERENQRRNNDNVGWETQASLFFHQLAFYVSLAYWLLCSN